MNEEFPRRNHHVIPRHYLKGFSSKEDSKFIWVYTRGRKYNPGKQHEHIYSPCLRSLSKAGAVRDFYSEANIFGDADYDSVEKKLEQLEKPAQPIIDKIRCTETISTNEKAVLSEYIILMWKRGDYHRSDPYGIWENTRDKTFAEVYEGFLTNPDEFIVEHKLKGTHEQIEQLLQVMYADYVKSDRMKIKVFNQATLSPSDIMTEHLSKMNWIFALNTGSSPFITSDTPVYFYKKAGLKKSDLTFPISSNILLVATKEDFQDSFRNMPESYVRIANRRTANLAVNYLFAPINVRWLTNIANKGRYHERYLVEP